VVSGQWSVVLVPTLGVGPVLPDAPRRFGQRRALLAVRSHAERGNKGNSFLLAALTIVCLVVTDHVTCPDFRSALEARRLLGSHRSRRRSKAQAFAWLDEKKIDADVRAKAVAIWADLAPTASEDDSAGAIGPDFSP